MFRFAVLLCLTSVALGLSSSDIKVSFKAIKSSVGSIEDIALFAIITNPTDKDIRLFNKNNLLDASATRSFDVSKNGSGVQFTGVRAFYDLSSDEVYTTIPANSSVAVNHTGLAALYDFEQHGTGEFTFAPNSVFQAGPDTDAVELAINAVKVNVTSDVARRELISLEARTSTPSCLNADRLKMLKAAHDDSKVLAKQTQAYIKSNPNGAILKKYFKTNDHTAISNRFGLIANDHGSRKIFCSNDGDPAKICVSGNGVVAYTWLKLSNGKIVASDIYACNGFFTGIQTTQHTCTISGVINNSKGGVILHEMSHATSKTDDIGYGCASVNSLSAAKQKNNADNYQCMALAVHRQFHC